MLDSKVFSVVPAVGGQPPPPPTPLDDKVIVKDWAPPVRLAASMQG